MIRDVHPGSGSWFFTHTGSRGKKDYMYIVQCKCIEYDTTELSKCIYKQICRVFVDKGKVLHKKFIISSFIRWQNTITGQVKYKPEHIFLRFSAFLTELFALFLNGQLSNLVFFIWQSAIQHSFWFILNPTANYRLNIFLPSFCTLWAVVWIQTGLNTEPDP